MKDFSELTLMDDYMFGQVMRNPRYLKPLIEFILKIKVRKIELIEPQKHLKEKYSAKGVYLDLFVEDENNVIYNVEVQASNKHNLPRRMRYYQSIIDLHVLSPGADYSNLNTSYIIFICNYDPYNLGRYVYTFENRCLEKLDLPFGDGTVKAVVNTKGTEGSISEELKETILYLDKGIVSGEFSKELDEAVNQVKSSEERRLEYMVLMARETEIREEGRMEGRAEGRKEGRMEGRAEGEKLFGDLMTRLKASGRIDDAFKAASDADYRHKLYQEFRMS